MQIITISYHFCPLGLHGMILANNHKKTRKGLPMRKTKPDATLDIRELIAPVTLLKVENRLASMKIGQILEVVSTDKETKVDLARIAKNAGHGFVSTTRDAETYHIFIERR